MTTPNSYARTPEPRQSTFRRRVRFAAPVVVVAGLGAATLGSSQGPGATAPDGTTEASTVVFNPPPPEPTTTTAEDIAIVNPPPTTTASFIADPTPPSTTTTLEPSFSVNPPPPSSPRRDAIPPTGEQRLEPAIGIVSSTWLTHRSPSPVRPYLAALPRTSATYGCLEKDQAQTTAQGVRACWAWTCRRCSHGGAPCTSTGRTQILPLAAPSTSAVGAGERRWRTDRLVRLASSRHLARGCPTRTGLTAMRPPA